MNAPVEQVREPHAVRDHQEAAAGACHEAGHQLHHLVRGRLVQIAGRFVGQQQRRLVRERAADGDALLLPAGQLLGIAIEQIGEAEPFGELDLPCGVETFGDARLK